MEVHLRIIGVLLIILAFAHGFFYRYFNWKEDLAQLSLINKQMMLIHTLFIAVVVFFMGLLCLIATSELIQTNLGKTISLGFSVFWTLRLLIQFFGYSSKLWKGKVFETTVHIVFSILWGYFSFVFYLVYSS